MSVDPRNIPPVFSIDVTPDRRATAPTTDSGAETAALLRQLVGLQQKQCKLMEDLIQSVNAAQKQRQNELHQWRESNPELAAQCRTAVDTLCRVQSQFLKNLTQDVADNEEYLVDGDFMLQEFVDRYGPRLAHLNGVLQVLSQLSAP